MKLSQIFCACGLHNWESEPSKKEFLRHDGFDSIFGAEAIQTGVKSCVREECDATKNVARTGMTGGLFGGGSAGKWKDISAARKAEIERKPVF